MKILITGASGYIGTILRQVFANDEVTLLSRRPLAAGRNEKWFVSGNVQSEFWWNSLPPDRDIDVIFHLAEPVKEHFAGTVKNAVIEGHLAFINHFSAKGAKLVYPLTAYIYDGRLSRSNANYMEIKQAIYQRLKGNAKVSFPIIHPLSDSAQGLGRLIQLEKRVPLVNVMCAFEATIPVLRLEHLRQAFAEPGLMTPGRHDVYSEIAPIKQLFNDDARANIRVLSQALRFVLTLLSFVPSFSLLVNGRDIDAAKR